MSRARSKTVDTAEVKKNGIPRRLNEKIALMKKKELAQSQAFEQAMQSIFEMQQAQIHSGGGSMPSLQNIDSTPSNNSLQPVSTSPYPSSMFVENSCCLATPPMTHHIRERPLSGGIVGRGPPVERTLSCEVEGHSRHSSPHSVSNNSWNIHKSESNLQQSLVDHMTALQTPPPFIQSQAPPTIMTSPSTNGYSNHTHYNSDQVGTQKAPETWSNSQNFPISSQFTSNSSAGSGGVTAAALLSPDHTTCTANTTGGMTSNIDPGLIGSASSLPDLTNFEFSSGLDVPIERDDDSPTLNKVNPFNFPSPGPSKLALSSMAVGPLGSPTSYSTNSPHTVGGSDVRSHPYYHTHHTGGAGGMVPRSPTMPEFRTTHEQLSAPPVRKFKPGATNRHHGYKTPPSYSDSYMSMMSSPTSGYDNVYQTQSSQSLPQYNNGGGGGGGTATGVSYPSPPYIQPTAPNTVHHMSAGSPYNEVNPPLLGTTPATSIQNTQQKQGYNTSGIVPGLQIDNSMLFGMEQQTQMQLPNSPAKPPSLASTTSSGYVSLSAYLDAGNTSSTQQQRALQQRLANISVSKDSPPLRSHSEENLMKMQKDISKNDSIIQQNPFMGNMSNASSVPCVYVESNAVEPCADEYESYTTGTGSPSTSASHASSPPMHRSDWLEHHSHAINDFVFQDWPLESSAGVSDKMKFGSPLSHHKSLTELNKIGDCLNMELSPSSSSRAHQLSLPSIVMGDLIAMDDHNLEKQDSGPFLPDDFDMEDDVVDNILRNEDFSSFNVNMMGGAGMIGAAVTSSNGMGGACMIGSGNGIPGQESVLLDSSDLYQHASTSIQF